MSYSSMFLPLGKEDLRPDEKFQPKKKRKRKEIRDEKSNFILLSSFFVSVASLEIISKLELHWRGRTEE